MSKGHKMLHYKMQSEFQKLYFHGHGNKAVKQEHDQDNDIIQSSSCDYIVTELTDKATIT